MPQRLATFDSHHASFLGDYDVSPVLLKRIDTPHTVTIDS